MTYGRKVISTNDHWKQMISTIRKCDDYSNEEMVVLAAMMENVLWSTMKINEYSMLLTGFTGTANIDLYNKTSDSNAQTPRQKFVDQKLKEFNLSGLSWRMDKDAWASLATTNNTGQIHIQVILKVDESIAKENIVALKLSGQIPTVETIKAFLDEFNFG